ncbi:MAG: aromatic ring-hydroxylating dioxygenase subunit alpha [Proteobacteria bacterium]|nr:aromatic ring-hydroxylating dioxygenase subunit alpha [Pseudomonadota bacterium]
MRLENLIIDDEERGVFRVRRRAFTDPEILQLERERIFEASWIYTGHESEIPSAGDYVCRRVAGRSLILVRSSDNVVRAFLNSCPHRGAAVCAAGSGNAKNFTCPYHGWGFANTGQLVAVPSQDDYPRSFQRADFSLRQTARCQLYRGFIFVNLDATITSLEQYLGGAKEYLDLLCDQSEAGLEMVSGHHLYSIRANWKLLAENTMESYHTPVAHKRYMGYMADRGVARKAMKRKGFGEILGQGHIAMGSAPPLGGKPIAYWSPLFPAQKKAEMQAVQQRLADKFGPEKAARMSQMSRNILVFPNLIILDLMAICVRTWFPVAPDYMEVSTWCLAPRDEDSTTRALRIDSFMSFFGPTGFATPDDVEILESCQHGYRNKEIEWSDLSKGLHKDKPTNADEAHLRGFWRQWHRLLTRSRDS